MKRAFLMLLERKDRVHWEQMGYTVFDYQKLSHTREWKVYIKLPYANKHITR